MVTSLIRGGVAAWFEKCYGQSSGPWGPESWTGYLSTRFSTHSRQVPGKFNSCVKLFRSKKSLFFIRHVYKCFIWCPEYDVLHKPTWSEVVGLFITFCCHCALNTKRHSAKSAVDKAITGHNAPKIGSRPSDHYFHIVCLSVCLFVQSFSQPSLIRLGHMLYVWV